MTKIFYKLLILLSMVLIVTLGSCDKSGVSLAAETYSEVSEDDFNRELFYMNTLEFEVADPTIIYAEHGVGAGYFYVFGTSDQISCHGIQCWRSKDLANWEYQGVALEPDAQNTWGVNNYWAPEIIYDDEYELYFLFYNADNFKDGGSRTLSVACSENVMGPYVIPDGFENSKGEMLSADKPVFDLKAHQDEIPVDVRKHAIDASPFVDPTTGKRYMYWSWYNNDDTETSDINEFRQEIFGMEMIDWFTPKYETVTQLTELEVTTVGGSEPIDDGYPAINEGPFMYYKDGTYFLTFSVYPYTDSNYQVHLATSDSPLPAKGFEKLPLDDGGIVMSTDPSWSHVASAGHHQFVEVGDQLLAVYHTYRDRATIFEGRALAIDEVKFVENSKGQLTFHVNGPTYSIQPIPSVLSGYSNYASKAKVTTSNLKKGSSADYLTDGVVKIKEYDLAKETEFKSGKSKINFSFDSPVELKSVMVYNSHHIDTAFEEIQSIKLEYVCDAKGNTKIAQINNVKFDYNFYTLYSTEMYPGAASIAEFENLPVVNVEINFNVKHEFNIGEIKLLCADQPTIKEGYKSELSKKYTYNNNVELNHYRNEGIVLGGTDLYEATYGWDLSTDDGSKDAYVTTNGIGDSYTYFKDLITDKFYAEAYLSTFSDTAYVLSKGPDPYPKFGMCVRNKDACMFFFVDGSYDYTNKQVGYTQSVSGQSGVWDWDATKKIESVDITYCNSELDLDGKFVKLAILRDGDYFYMLVNDEVIFIDSSVKDLTEGIDASVGFLGFNTPLVIKDYKITTNTSEIEELRASYDAVSIGETLGNGSTSEASAGWDLSNDNSNSPYVTTEKIGDSSIYFKDCYETKFYTEGYFATTKDVVNGDLYPKFGMVVRGYRGCVYFYVDADNNFTGQTVGYIQSKEDNPGVFGQEEWAKAVTKQENIKYDNESLDLDGNFVKLAILRDGSTYYMFVNDKLVFTVSNLYQLGEFDDDNFPNIADVGFLSWNTKLLVKDYMITTDSAAVDAKLAELR